MGRKQAERQAKIAQATASELGEEVICDRCGTTTQQMAEKCTAALDDPCPGFMRYDAVRTKYERLIRP